MIRIAALLVVSIIAAAGAANNAAIDSAAQLSWRWRLRFNGFADNREYFNPITEPQTILGAHLGGGVELRVADAHTVHLGGVLLQEFGSRHGIDRATPFAYYQHDGHLSRFVFGIFPRTLLGAYPRALLNDTLAYYRPGLEGALYRIRGAWGEQTAWLDWTSRQTDTRRETFLCGFDGVARYRFLFVRHAFCYYHFAGPRIRIPGDHVRDNGGGTIEAGVVFRDWRPLDSACVALGGLGSYDRTRGVSGWQTATGATATLEAASRWFVLRCLIYAGDAHTIDWGDAFYRAPRYARIDLGVTPIATARVTGRFDYSFHLTDNRLDHQQAFRIDASFGGRFSRAGQN
jgi:hypothetical protein